VSYSFKGSIERDGSERKISGTFNGAGPAGCAAAGDFDITIR
jgi:hypothetical protein